MTTYPRLRGLVCGGVATLVFIMAGCQQEPTSSLTPADGGTNAGTNDGNNGSFFSISTDTSYSWLQNPANPHNIWGLIHNRALDYIDDHTPLVCHDSDVANATRDYLFVDSVCTGSELYSSMPSEIMTSIPHYSSDSLEVYYSRMYNGAGLSTAERAALDSVFAVVRREPTLPLMLTALSAIESDVINSSAMTNEQKALPLVIVALAKHSAAYWFPISDMVEVPRARKGERSSFGKMAGRQQSAANQIIEADLVGGIWGAVGGFVFGAGWGAVTGFIAGGPAGAVAGGAIGALAGSARGAVTAGIASSGVKATNLNKSTGKVAYGGGRKR